MEHERVPTGDRVLWEGTPDRVHLRRMLARETLPAVVGNVVSMALMFGAIGAWFGPGFSIPLVVLVLFLGLAAFQPIANGYAAYRQGSRRRYRITDRHVLVDGGGASATQRLLDLPSPRLEAIGDGFGNISVMPPASETQLRIVQWASRFVPMARQQPRLMVAVPNAQNVLGVLLRAQAERLAEAPEAVDATGRRVIMPYTGRYRLPRARQSFVQSLAIAPVWFGAIFLVFGLFMAMPMLAAPGGLPFALIPGAFAAFGGLALYSSLHAGVVARRLARSGTPTVGHVIGVTSANVTINDMTQWVVQYEFQVVGVPYQGQSRMMLEGEAQRYTPGDPVPVRYDAAHPAQNMMLEGSAA